MSLSVLARWRCLLIFSDGMFLLDDTLIFSHCVSSSLFCVRLSVVNCCISCNYWFSVVLAWLLKLFALIASLSLHRFLAASVCTRSLGIRRIFRADNHSRIFLRFCVGLFFYLPLMFQVSIDICRSSLRYAFSPTSLCL